MQFIRILFSLLVMLNPLGFASLTVNKLAEFMSFLLHYVPCTKYTERHYKNLLVHAFNAIFPMYAECVREFVCVSMVGRASVREKKNLNEEIELVYIKLSSLDNTTHTIAESLFSFY